MADWMASPSASAVVAAATAKASTTALLQLPQQLSLLPYLFRMMALAFFMPVIVLALGDCLGWAVFKLILRPLGYSSVVRFKDPEPPTTRLSGSAKRPRSSSRPRSRGHRKLNDSGSPLQRTSSLPATFRPRRHSTDETLHASPLGAFDSTVSPPSERAGSPTSTASSSNSSSPILVDYSTSSSLASSPSSSPKSSDLALPSGSDPHPSQRPRPRSASTGSSSFISALRRHRAASVGVEGPLFGTPEDDEVPGLFSPARSDTEELPAMTESESEGEGASGKSQLRKRRGRQAGVPRRGPQFDFTAM